ncbi:MAG: macro domain-containing protein [Myxococcota bacterium]
MAIIYVAGDLFHRSQSFSALAHGCNCAGKMGRGIAVAFRKQFPAMYRDYQQSCQIGAFVPGNTYPWRDGHQWIYNLATHGHWRSTAKLEYVHAALSVMMLHARDQKVREIALPRIGAGLGGLSWDDVRAALARYQDAKTDLIVFETYTADTAAIHRETVGTPRHPMAKSLGAGS